MDCRDAERYLQPYVDGEFDADDNGEIEQHFKFCPVCQKKVLYLAWFKRELKQAVPDVAAPAGLKRRLREALREEQGRRTPLALKLAPAFAVALVFLAVFFWPRIEVNSPIVEAAVERHIKQLPNDVKSSDYQHVRSFVQDKLNYAIPIPRFEGQRRPLVLTGGRIATFSGGAGAAAFEYVGQGKRYTLMAAPFSQALFKAPGGRARLVGKREFLVGHYQGLGVVMWHDAHTVYSLVGDEDEDTLMDLAAEGDYAF